MASLQAASIVTYDMLVGQQGNFVTTFGNTSACVKLFAWAMTVEVALQIPAAVVQGTVWYGNAPANLVVGRTVNELLLLSTEMKAEKGGQTYSIKSTIVERGLAHTPYGTYTQ